MVEITVKVNGDIILAANWEQARWEHLENADDEQIILKRIWQTSDLTMADFQT